MTAAQLVAGLDQRGARILALGSQRLRAVTHYGIAQHIKEALSALQQLL